MYVALQPQSEDFIWQEEKKKQPMGLLELATLSLLHSDRRD